MSAVSDGPAVQHNSRARRVSIDAKVLMTAFIKNCRVASIRPQPTTPPLSPDTPRKVLEADGKLAPHRDLGWPAGGTSAWCKKGGYSRQPLARQRPLSPRQPTT